MKGVPTHNMDGGFRRIPRLACISGMQDEPRHCHSDPPLFTDSHRVRVVGLAAFVWQ